MVKIKVILGEQACKTYEVTGSYERTREIIDKVGGRIDEYDFNTEDEYEAFKLGLNVGGMWDEFWIVEKNGKKLSEQ